MREIKFRAWEEKGKDMIYSNRGNFVIELDGKCSFIEWGTDYFKAMPDLVLMQFTGLKDKNGKEIYEGDILKTHFGKTIGRGTKWIERLSLIEWNEDDLGFEVKTIIDKQITIKEVENELLGKSEIIGNIYENPEMLDALQVSGEQNEEEI